MRLPKRAEVEEKEVSRFARCSLMMKVTEGLDSSRGSRNNCGGGTFYWSCECQCVCVYFFLFLRKIKHKLNHLNENLTYGEEKLFVRVRVRVGSNCNLPYLTCQTWLRNLLTTITNRLSASLWISCSLARPHSLSLSPLCLPDLSI